MVAPMNRTGGGPDSKYVRWAKEKHSGLVLRASRLGVAPHIGPALDPTMGMTLARVYHLCKYAQRLKKETREFAAGGIFYNHRDGRLIHYVNHLQLVYEGTLTEEQEQLARERGREHHLRTQAVDRVMRAWTAYTSILLKMSGDRGWLKHPSDDMGSLGWRATSLVLTGKVSGRIFPFSVTISNYDGGIPNMEAEDWPWTDISRHVIREST